jgi:hypothetical protein
MANEMIISILGTLYLFPNEDSKEVKKKAREEKGKKVEMGNILLFEDDPVNNTILHQVESTNDSNNNKPNNRLDEPQLSNSKSDNNIKITIAIEED